MNTLFKIWFHFRVIFPIERQKNHLNHTISNDLLFVCTDGWMDGQFILLHPQQRARKWKNSGLDLKND